MIKIKGRKILITRGDCRPFTITFTGTDVPEDGTAVLFTVKKVSERSEPVIEKRPERFISGDGRHKGVRKLETNNQLWIKNNRR